jgi:DNA-nicking Smr family endonuclease
MLGDEGSDDDFFSVMVGEQVAPIKTEKRVILQKNIEDSKTLETRRLLAEVEVVASADPLAGEPIEMLSPSAELSFRRPGVQHGVFRNLRLGKYSLDARLDLHKLTVDQARREVYQFVQDCMANDVRSALITHGKGEWREKPAVLKSYVAHWLPQMNEVLAFHSAQKPHGGYGATYVLLRKSERKKSDNRERFSRRD